jgi:nitric oxide reductase large subunit
MASSQSKYGSLLLALVSWFAVGIGSGAASAQELISRIYVNGPDVRHITIHPAILGAWLIAGFYCVIVGLRRTASRGAHKQMHLASSRLLVIGIMVIVVGRATLTVIDL